MRQHHVLLLVLLIVCAITVVVLYGEMLLSAIRGGPTVTEERVKQRKFVVPPLVTDDEMLDILQNSTRHTQNPPRNNMVNMVVGFAYVLDLKKDVDLKTRQAEFIDTLWRNMHHEHIWSIHVLYQEVKHALYITTQLRLLGRNSTLYTQNGLTGADAVIRQKMFLRALPAGQQYEYKHAFEYANNNLPGWVVWIGNSDIYLAEGWEQVSVAGMKVTNRAYILTRAEQCGETRQACKGGKSALHDGADGFVVIPPIVPEALVGMNHPTFVQGAENNVLFQLMTRANLSVTNPCMVLVIVHNHCSDIRPSESTERVNGGWDGRRGSRVVRPSWDL